MSLNPGLAQQLASSRREDLAREVRGQEGVGLSIPAAGGRGPRTRPAVVRHVGAFLIAAGCRLTGADGWQTAFDHGQRS
jgi:hypothetical protein